MKYIGEPFATREIGVRCDCGGKAENAVHIVIDSQGYLVIEGKCTLCFIRLKVSFALTELKTLIPKAVCDE